MHAKVKVYSDTVRETAVIPLVSLNLTKKQNEDIQLGQLKSVQEYEHNRFCFPLTL